MPVHQNMSSKARVGKHLIGVGDFGSTFLKLPNGNRIGLQFLEPFEYGEPPGMAAQFTEGFDS